MRNGFCLAISLCALAIGCGGPEPAGEAGPAAESVPEGITESDESVLEPPAAPRENPISRPAEPGDSEPDPIVYVVDGTHYYHNESCQFIQNAERSILKDKRNMALMSGYVPCKVCEPDGPGKNFDSH